MALCVWSGMPCCLVGSLCWFNDKVLHISRLFLLCYVIFLSGINRNREQRDRLAGAGLFRTRAALVRHTLPDVLR